MPNCELLPRYLRLRAGEAQDADVRKLHEHAHACAVRASSPDPQDLANRTLVKIQRGSAFIGEEEDRFLAWFSRVISNGVIDQWRRLPRPTRPLSDVPPELSTAPEHLLSTAVELLAGIARLREEETKIRFLSVESDEEAAKRLNISCNAIRRRRYSLRQEMKRHEAVFFATALHPEATDEEIASLLNTEAAADAEGGPAEPLKPSHVAEFRELRARTIRRFGL